MKRVFITVAVVLLALPVFAQHGGMPPAGGDHHEGSAAFGFDGGDPLVTSDGTVLVIRPVADTTAHTVSLQIVAVHPNGTIAWTSTLAGGHEHLLLSGSNLISVTQTTATDGTVSTTLAAMSTSSGSQAWSRTLAGVVTSLSPFNGGTYAVVVTPAATTGGTATRSLVAIGNDGSVLWTLALP